MAVGLIRIARGLITVREVAGCLPVSSHRWHLDDLRPAMSERGTSRPAVVGVNDVALTGFMYNAAANEDTQTMVQIRNSDDHRK